MRANASCDTLVAGGEDKEGDSGMFDWYFGIRPLARFLFSVFLLGIAGVVYLTTGLLMIGLLVVGGVMLALSFPTDGEKNKWGDW